MGDRMTVRVRPYVEEDKPLIMSSWLRSYRKGCDDARRIFRPLYFSSQQDWIRGILARPDARVIVACSPGRDDLDERTIFGWLCYEPNPRMDRPTLHYLYVKEPFRELGVASQLLESTGMDLDGMYLSHLTRDKFDMDPGSPTYGKARWRGGETLLRRHPLAWEEVKKSRGKVDVKMHGGNKFWIHLQVITH